MSTQRLFLVLIALITVGPVPGCGSGTSAPRPKRIVFVSMDTVRADALGELDSGDLPNLEAIANDGARFRNFYASSTYTIPSHMAMLTGLDPEALGAFDGKSALPSGVATLAVRLKDAGYATRGFHEGGFVQARYGFSRGFDEYEELPRAAVVGRELPRILDWMAAQGDEPYFLFLHTYAAHNPYGGYDDYRARHPERGLPDRAEIRALDEKLRTDESARTPEAALDLTVYNQLADATSERVSSAPNLLTPGFARTPHFQEDLGAMRRGYAERVRLIDAALGRIRAQLEAAGQWEDTLLVVTSDHGEAFFEHGLVWHGYVPFDEVLRVPLVVSYPRLFEGHAPLVVDDLAWHLDLYPTVLNLAGLDAEDDRGGLDFTPLLAGLRAPADDRVVFPVVLEVPFRGKLPARRTAIQVGAKFIEGHRRFGSKVDMLFDLASDPAERRSVANREPERADDLRAELERYREGLVKHKAAAAREAEGEEADRLRELGYGD